jgi:hypothetical protein
VGHPPAVFLVVPVVAGAAPTTAVADVVGIVVTIGELELLGHLVASRHTSSLSK